MKKSSTLTGLAIVLLYACQMGSSPSEKLSEDQADSISKAISRESPEDILICRKAMSNPIQRKGLFKFHCPNDTFLGIPISSNKPFPFDTSSVKKNDTLYFSFKVSNDCCLKYFGDYSLKSDTLAFTYGYCDESVCDCYCDYILKYKVPLKQYKFRKTTIRTVDPKNLNY